MHAPVPEAAIFRLLEASHPAEEWEQSATDVVQAYLQQDEYEIVEGIPLEDNWIATRMQNPWTLEWEFHWMTGEIYGGQKAGAGWHKKVTAVHKDMGMEEGKNAKSVYITADKKCKTAVHVDDPITFSRREKAMLGGVNRAHREWYHHQLGSHLKLNETEILTVKSWLDYLSMQISLSKENKNRISNVPYLFKLLKEKGMLDCNPVKCPISKDKIKLCAEEAELGMFLDAEQKTQYQADVGNLNWIVETFCPKLAVTASLLGSRNANPTVSGPSMIKQALRWVRGNLGMCLQSDKDSSGMQWYVDADLAGLWAVNGETRSRMGILGMYNGMPFFWKSTWIKAIVTSTAESEVYALVECVKWVLHFNHVCEELGIHLEAKTPVWCDATAAIAFLKNIGGPSQSKLKHIDLRLSFLGQNMDRIDLNHIDGLQNHANFLTKVLSPIDFEKEGEHLMSEVELPSSVIEELADVSSRGHGEIQRG